jgi:hypothetical protein
MLKKSVKVSNRNVCLHLLIVDILLDVLIINELYKELPLVVMLNRIVRKFY